MPAFHASPLTKVGAAVRPSSCTVARTPSRSPRSRPRSGSASSDACSSRKPAAARTPPVTPSRCTSGTAKAKLTRLARHPAAHRLRKRCRPRRTPSSPATASCAPSSATAATSSSGASRPATVPCGRRRATTSRSSAISVLAATISSKVERTMRSWRTRSPLAAAIACAAVCASPRPVNIASSCTVSSTEEKSPKARGSPTLRLTSTLSANRNARDAALPRPASSASRSSAADSSAARRARTRAGQRPGQRPVLRAIGSFTPPRPCARRATRAGRTACRTARRSSRCAAPDCRS